jgi:hypothetical protein
MYKNILKIPVIFRTSKAQINMQTTLVTSQQNGSTLAQMPVPLASPTN